MCYKEASELTLGADGQLEVLICTKAKRPVRVLNPRGLHMQLPPVTRRCTLTIRPIPCMSACSARNLAGLLTPASLGHQAGHDGNWLELLPDPTAHQLIVRQTFLRRAEEQTAELRLERVGGLPTLILISARLAAL